MAAVTSFAGLLVCRVLLGIAEAGFFPGIVYYLTFWYKPQERALRIAAFYCSAPLSGAIGGLLAYGILRIDVLGLVGWRWLFLLEGIPSVIAGVFTMLYLPSFPSTSNWLSTEEKEWVISRLPASSVATGFNRRKFKETLCNPVVWLFAMINFCLITPLYVCSFYMPKIIELIGFSTLNSNLLSVPVFASAAVGVILNARHSDKRGERVFHTVLPVMVSSDHPGA